MASYKDLGIPASSSIVNVRVFNTASPDLFMPASSLMTPVLAGREKFFLPIFCFMIEHPESKRRLFFDLGMRKDKDSYPPEFLALLSNVSNDLFNLHIEEDLIDLLVAAKIPLESIDTVIWSHTHLDHIGDISKFPASTGLVVGKGAPREGPGVGTQERDWSGRNVTEVNFDDASLVIGGFRAVDYLGDGSLYLLDVPGHMPGHISALCRVTPTSFVFLGGDTCHHPGVFRPTDQLHKDMPCPGVLLAVANKSISVSLFSKGGDQFDLNARKHPFLDIPDNGSYADPPTARISIQTLGNFDANPDVFVMIAHDETLLGNIDLYPGSVNEWKVKGWKEKLTWSFVDPTNSAYRLGPA